MAPEVTDRIIWQSELFPRLVMGEKHLALLRKCYPEINRFEPHLREAELWLFAHPERVPKRNWKRFINAWMRNVRKFRKQENVRQGDSSRREDNDPRALGEILKRMRE